PHRPVVQLAKHDETRRITSDEIASMTDCLLRQLSRGTRPHHVLGNCRPPSGRRNGSRVAKVFGIVCVAHCLPCPLPHVPALKPPCKFSPSRFGVGRERARDKCSWPQTNVCHLGIVEPDWPAVRRLVSSNDVDVQ